MYGHYFDAEITGSEDGGKIYRKGSEKYEVAGYKPEYVYESGQMTILPRIYRGQDNHVTSEEHKFALQSLKRKYDAVLCMNKKYSHTHNNIQQNNETTTA